MKKGIMGLMIVMSSLAMANNGGMRVICRPGNLQNGLGIQKLVLDISTEDPEAVMELLYRQSSQSIVSSMSYDGDSFSYHFIPTGRRDGQVSVSLKSHGNVWTASVNDESIDTFSILSCEQN
jgi:hypothetical protein